MEMKAVSSSSNATSSSLRSLLRIVDIGANLTDSCFRGVYRGKRVHDDDFQHILKRAEQVGVHQIMITAGTREDVKEALTLIQQNQSSNSIGLWTTVGVHPTRCSQEFESEDKSEATIDGEANLSTLLGWAETHSALKEGRVEGEPRGSVVAIGEFGLDYDRLQFCPKEIQKRWFERQFILAERTKLPLFLHLRNAEEDFIEIIKQNRHRFTKGVVHSYTSEDPTHLQSLLDLDLYIGINGCSLKTQKNLDILKLIPLNRIMIETDAPYCDIKPSSPSSKFIDKKSPPTSWPSVKKEKHTPANGVVGVTVKTRNEPCFVRQVLEVIAGVKGETDLQKVADQIYENTCSVFFPWLHREEKR